MKNMSFKFKHPNFGELIATISSGEELKNTSNIIPATFLVANKNKDTQSFLFALYELYANSNDTMTDIIGGYLVAENLKMTNEEIVKKINETYSNYTQKKNKKFSSELEAGDGIDAKIIKVDNPTDPIYSATIKVQDYQGRLVAYIDNQHTHPSYRRNGLMKTMINKYLPKYCASNDLTDITLEIGELDGIDKAILRKIYTSCGFEKQGKYYVKPVEFESENYLDEYTADGM